MAVQLISSGISCFARCVVKTLKNNKFNNKFSSKENFGLNTVKYG